VAGLGASIRLLGNGEGAGLTVAPQEATLSEEFRFAESHPTYTARLTASTAMGIGIAPVQTPLIRPGRIISETVRIQQASSINVNWTWTVTEQLYMTSALKTARSVALTGGIGAHDALTLSVAVTVLQGLGVAPSPLPSLKYTQTLAQGLGIASAFRNFFGAALSDGIGSHEVLTRQFTAHPTLAEGVGIAAALSNHFLLRVTAADTIGINPTETLAAIFNGVLADDVEIVAGYVAPDGNFTTWAINTRTGATTEYSNYAFNSFARVGNVYLGASSTGLYQLVGDTDDGTSIIADIKSGFAEWGGSRFTMFKGAYIGMRGTGSFVLKLVTGDNKTYIYALTADNMRTTKVVMGKGVRTRYFAFELISTGQDFDLDMIEFVPLVSERRV
jgi:hypothetical protein